MNNRKILVIEDEATLQKTLCEYLITEKFEVISASDGEEGLKLAESQLPDLIVLDIILPKMDGYEVLKEIKKNEKTREIPVILLTNLESPENVQKAFERGATTYLVKADYKLEDVVKKIKNMLKI